MRKKLRRLVITGSEGLIGRQLCRHFGGRFEILKLDLALGYDLTDENFVGEWFRKNKNLYGMIIGHAYNAPVPLARVENKKIEPHQMSLDEVRRYFEVNSISPLNLCRHFVKNNKKGVIINISSIYGTVAPRHYIYKDFVKSIGYPMSKAALNMMTKYLATYYAPKFRFNTIVFGGVAAGKQDPQFVAEYSKHTPMRRLLNIDEVSSVFDFLLDERSSYVTGTEVFVDGGWTAW